MQRAGVPEHRQLEQRVGEVGDVHRAADLVREERHAGRVLDRGEHGPLVRRG